MKHLTKILIGVALILFISTAYYFLDYQSNPELKEAVPVKEMPSEFTICQFNKCVDFEAGEINYDKGASDFFKKDCWFVKTTDFCGDFTITKNR
jgi:hypothetical protein